MLLQSVSFLIPLAPTALPWAMEFVCEPSYTHESFWKPVIRDECTLVRNQ